MKVLTVVLVAVLCFVVVNSQTLSKFDNFNVDEVLDNDRILKNYIKCMMDEGACTSEGKELRKNLPEALEKKCAECTPAQKEKIRKVVKHLRNKKPKDWERLTKKFDPEGKYKTAYEEFINGA